MNQNEDTTRPAVILGALLHDIGKFAQRAEEKLNSEDERLIPLACPHYKEKYRHFHVVHSARFVRGYLENSEIENLVLYHHLPDNYDKDRLSAKIITLADWLSCGERRDREIDESVGEVKREPLRSIFSQLAINGDNINEQYSPTRSLNNDLNNLFPVVKKEALSQNPDEENSFAFQWSEFCKEAEKINLGNPDFEILFTRLLSLLEKYTLFIPSSAYKDKPEISLFHHLKSTAAIATCLYDLKLSEKEVDNLLNALRQNVNEVLSSESFLFVGGDISGIQDFIYSVTSEKALKGLRGRSFYLQLLAETVARRILDSFNLPLCNLIYCGGGHFYILIPKTKEIEKNLANIFTEIDSNIFEAHRGKLALIASSTPLTYADFKRENFNRVWSRIGEKLAIEKRKKFSSLVERKTIFGPCDIGGEEKACEICGDEIKDEREKCSLCESFEELANEIRNALYLQIERVERVEELTGRAKKYGELLKSIGYHYSFQEELELKDYKHTFAINNLEFLSNKLAGFRFEAFHSPVKKDGTGATLEDIAKKATGLQKWGALRMDADNLSEIFEKGLNYMTISRMSMLSYMFSLFFSARVRHIIEKDYRDKTCIVYSGGDDLFVLGAWSVLPEIAKKIYDDFRKFTCHHPRITLSGGIYLAPSEKFPVYQAAKEAGEAEEKAKGEKKNRITFFDVPLKWDRLEELSKIKEEIYQLLTGKKDGKKIPSIPRSLLTLLYSAIEDKKKVKISRIWLLLYGLKRLTERYIKNSDEQMALAMELKDTFITNNELREHLDISVRWAEYLTRKEE